MNRLQSRAQVCGLRNSAMPVCGLTVDSQETPHLLRLLSIAGARQGRSLDIVKVFHKIYLSRLIDSFRCVRVRFSPYGLVHDTSIRRGTRPRHRRALVHSCRAAAGITSPNCSRPAAGAAITANSPFSRISRKPRPRSKPGAICRRARHPATIPPSTCPGSARATSAAAAREMLRDQARRLAQAAAAGAESRPNRRHRSISIVAGSRSRARSERGTVGAGDATCDRTAFRS